MGIRQLLNMMIRDGAPYTLIYKKLADSGHKISVDNLSRCHSGPLLVGTARCAFRAAFNRAIVWFRSPINSHSLKLRRHLA